MYGMLSKMNSTLPVHSLQQPDRSHLRCDNVSNPNKKIKPERLTNWSMPKEGLLTETIVGELSTVASEQSINDHMWGTVLCVLRFKRNRAEGNFGGLFVFLPPAVVSVFT